MPKRILFLYNEVTENERKGAFGECALKKDVDAIRDGLAKSNNDILSLDLYSPEQLDDYIKANQPIDLAFVIAEGYKDLPHTLYNGHGAALVRKQLFKYQIPCTHSSFESMELCRNKDLTYTKLAEKGVPIPRFIAFDSHFTGNIEGLFREARDVGYPLMVKPAGGGNSIGINNNSVVYNEEQLIKQIDYLRNLLGPGTLIIEKYLCGQEYTIGIIGNERKFILPIIGFPKELGIRDAKVKKLEYKLRNSFEIITEEDIRYQALLEIGVNTFDAVYANDIIRVDLKEDDKGNIYVIDVNGTPALSLTGSLTFMAGKAGINHSQLVKIILYESMLRYGLKPNVFFEDIINELSTKLIQHNSIEVA